MNKIKTNKVTYLAVAVLATTSLFTVNTNNTKADTVKSESKTNYQQVTTKSEIDQARKAVERGERETANDLTASLDYVKAVKKHASLAKWNKNKSNYDKDMYQGSLKTIENKENDYQHNKEDEQHQVNLDHITTDEYQEINEYAMRLINSVRSQTGRPNLVLNKDVMKMAKVIADKYNKDGRSDLDGKGHDYKAINDAARQFSLNNDPANKRQYYEDMSGWPTNVNGFISHDKTSFDANKYWYGWYINSDPKITHTVSMDYIKHEIYIDLAAMFFNNHEWNHAKSLLSIGDMNQDNKTKHYAFGMSISVLPHTNNVSTHFLIVPNNYYVHSNNPKVTPISNHADEKVTSLAQEKANLKKAQTKYQALLDASKGVSKQNDQTLIADQSKFDQAQNDAKPAKPDTDNTTNTIKAVKHSVLMRKNRAFYLINGKTMLKFKSYKQVVNYLLKQKISTEVRSNAVIKLAKNALFYTKSGKRTLHLIKRGKKLHISEFVMIKGHLYAHLTHSKFYIRTTRLF